MRSRFFKLFLGLTLGIVGCQSIHPVPIAHSMNKEKELIELLNNSTSTNMPEVEMESSKNTKPLHANVAMQTNPNDLGVELVVKKGNSALLSSEENPIPVNLIALNRCSSLICHCCEICCEIEVKCTTRHPYWGLFIEGLCVTNLTNGYLYLFECHPKWQPGSCEFRRNTILAPILILGLALASYIYETIQIRQPLVRLLRPVQPVQPLLQNPRQ